MTRKIQGSCFWVLFLFTGSLSFAQAPPMVEKHIFVPSADGQTESDRNKAENVSSLDKDFVFLGTVSGPKGKKAIVQEKGGEKKSIIKQEGDSINGMTLKTIGPNYLLLANESKSVHLKLYGGEKNRPSAPPPPAPAAAEETGNPLQKILSESMQGNEAEKPSEGDSPPALNPPPTGQDAKNAIFGGGRNQNKSNVKRSSTGKGSEGPQPSPPGGVNPFLEMLQRNQKK